VTGDGGVSGVPGAICLAVYRPDPDRLRAQIESIQTQTLSSWTCIVGIDGRDPVAESTVSEIVGDDPRFVVRAFADNVGFYRNFERLLAEVPTAAPWIALSDQDDVWYPHKLEALVPLLGRAVLASGSARLVDARGAEVGVTRRRYHGLGALLIDNQVTGSMVVLRSELLGAALPFPAPTDVSYHDHWLGVVAAASGEVRIVEDLLQDYVQHGNNVIGEESGGRIRRRAARLRELGGGAAFSVLRYLAVHRWGWRVAMARTVLDRMPDVKPAQRRVLEVFARGDASVAFVRIAASAVRRGSAPVGRSAALVAGSLAARLIRQR
jgi:hypothetical protein